MHKLYGLVYINGKPNIAKIAVDESYMPGQNDTNKKFCHVRAIKIKAIPSVGIGNSHTPIIDGTASTISISDLFALVKQHAKLYVSETIGNNHKFYWNRIEKASSDMGFNTEMGISTPRGNATSNDANISISKIFDFLKNVCKNRPPIPGCTSPLIYIYWYSGHLWIY